jgi:uncharacterized GH25 family protein
MRGSVYGHVTGANTGWPVSGITVLCGRGDFSPQQVGACSGGQAKSPSMSTQTDRGGWFRFENLAEGEWVLKTRGSSDYAVAEATVSVFNDAVSDLMIEIAGDPQLFMAEGPVTAICEPSLPERGNIRGCVISASKGTPVGYATVTVLSGPRALTDHLFVANGAGYFELNEMPVGEWLLRASSDGSSGVASVRVFDSVLSELAIEVEDRFDGAQPAPFEPYPEPARPATTGRVIGRVVRAEGGQPVANATVNILRGAGPAPDIAALTDSQGRFAFDELPAGSWLFRAVGPAEEAGFAQVSVPRASVAEALITVTVH